VRLGATTGTATFDQNVTLTTASLTGWTFDGWYTEATGGKKIESGTWTYDPREATEPGGDKYTTVTLYAHWTPTTYTVKLWQNKPSSSSQTVRRQGTSLAGWTWSDEGYYYATFTYDPEATLPVPSGTYLMTGWIIGSGWYTGTMSTGTPYARNLAAGYAATYTYRKTSPGKISTGTGTAKWNLTTVKNSVVNLYAGWTNEVYTINYHRNTPDNATHDTKDPADTAVTFDKTNTLPDIALTGWTFDGWYTNSTGTGDGDIRLSDYEGSNWTFDPAPDTMTNQNIQAYAHWTANTYTVKLMPNRPSISIQTVEALSKASGRNGFTWNSEGYYEAVLTYDTPSTLPEVAKMYAMQGWSTDTGWYRTRVSSKEPYAKDVAQGYNKEYTYKNTAPGMNSTGVGDAKWNLAEEQDAVVYLYTGWTDDYPGEPTSNTELPDRNPDQNILLTAKGTSTTTRTKQYGCLAGSVCTVCPRTR
jgi:uncharacterized repeat protein (TIGR02543 family)